MSSVSKLLIDPTPGWRKYFNLYEIVNFALFWWNVSGFRDRRGWKSDNFVFVNMVEALIELFHLTLMKLLEFRIGVYMQAVAVLTFLIQYCTQRYQGRKETKILSIVLFSTCTKHTNRVLYFLYICFPLSTDFLHHRKPALY